MLDGDIVVDGATTYLYYKNLNDGLLYGARSSTGQPNTFTDLHERPAPGQRHRGAAAAEDQRGRLAAVGRLLQPGQQRLLPWTSSNIGANAWAAANQRDYTPPLNAKHGSIAGITDAEYDALVSRWGLPSWVQAEVVQLPRPLRPPRQPGRPASTPIRSTRTRTSCGAWCRAWPTPRGVSFESVNRPGSYLRHYAYAMRPRPERRLGDVPGRRHLLPGGRAGRRLLVVVPVVQLPGPAPAPLRLPAAHRPDQLVVERRPTGRTRPSGCVSTAARKPRSASSDQRASRGGRRGTG